MRNVVTLPHRNVAAHADVKIDVKIQAHFAHETFIDLDNSGDRSGRISNEIDKFTLRRRVHDFGQSRPQQPITVGADQRTGKKRRPVVRALPRRATDN